MRDIFFGYSAAWSRRDPPSQGDRESAPVDNENLIEQEKASVRQDTPFGGMQETSTGSAANKVTKSDNPSVHYAFHERWRGRWCTVPSKPGHGV